MTLHPGSASTPDPTGVVDLNADVGESFGRWQLGDDDAVLPHLTSANVACGFHAGDPLTLRRTCETAVSHGVVIGAQVGYRDLAGFGRRYLDVPTDELAAEVLYQLGALDAIARAAGGRVAYLKPHGALYHAVSRYEEQAQAVLDAVLAFGGLPVLGLAGSPFLAAVRSAGLEAVAEGFVDRAYQRDGTLVPRSAAGAVLTDPVVVAAQAVELARSGEVRSLCVHGDSPGAPGLVAAVRAALAEAGIPAGAFTSA
ncbi:LamB/YcsF family protein [Nocardioides daeguensis]|uniref:5-oxoprolinase subunit PxpA n=1 Tax=Nocardioides daeguensis TaxID=908359 RepID=A0ABP6UXU1_9ACTN|nr:5-oxoprolinase subunit PxpA [Nocardioides daeguensis]MBV6725829.1 LamB/YcsF family protein [Nocardioides daeguensis]MCR1772656.1 LamB/YcsF family protein [Nocardioides daeguensis]